MTEFREWDTEWETTIPKFKSVLGLKRWLEISNMGQSILREIIDKRRYNEDRPRILAVQHADRVALYGSRYIPVYVSTQLHTQGGPEGSRLAEDFLEQSLPSMYRGILWPGRATPNRAGYLGEVSHRRVTPAQYEYTEALLDHVKALSNISRTEDPGEDELCLGRCREEDNQDDKEGLAGVWRHNIGAPQGNGSADFTGNGQVSRIPSGEESLGKSVRQTVSGSGQLGGGVGN